MIVTGSEARSVVYHVIVVVDPFVSDVLGEGYVRQMSHVAGVGSGGIGTGICALISKSTESPLIVN